MDVIFNCPHCDQELAVDSSGAGTEISCPSCNETITIPEPKSVIPRSGTDGEGAAVARVEPRPVNAMASSAAAKVELHLKVPSNKTTESLITKPLMPLEAAAKAEKGIKTKTIRHTDCVEVGHDKFDDVVSKFIGKIGEEDIISITPISYSYLDIGTQKQLTDFGVLIVYRG